MISFDGVDSGTNSHVMVSFLLDVGTFVERLFVSVLTLLVMYSIEKPFPKFDFAPLSPKFRYIFNGVGIGCTDPFGE
jgi:hypothetical protein